jgi:hypothetical protein
MWLTWVGPKSCDRRLRIVMARLLTFPLMLEQRIQFGSRNLEPHVARGRFGLRRYDSRIIEDYVDNLREIIKNLRRRLH